MRSDAPAHLLRPHLIRTIPAPKALVTVHVEDRHEDERDSLQSPGGGFIFQKLAQGKKARVLAVDLAGVDAALDEKHGQFVGGGIFRRQAGCARGDERHHGPPLRRAPEFKAAHRLRPLRCVGCAEPLDLLVAAGARVAGALGDGCKRIFRPCGVDRAHATADRSEARG